MIVVSAFDGMACGMQALKELGIPADYFAFEIDKYAISIAQKNHPSIMQCGDVRNSYKVPFDVDLLLGGSPCQGFSNAGAKLNFSDPRSKLFFDFARLRDELQPNNFLLENVYMKQEWQDVISSYLGVQPICINSSLVSAQNRKRLYWTDLPTFILPLDKGILLKDIVLPDVHLPLSEKALAYMDRKVKGGRNHWDFAHHSDINNDKSATVVANFFKGVPYNVLKDLTCIRHFHPIECERLQTLPDNYTEGVSKTQRYKMIGNGWTVEVIKHILKNCT
jgi:site-specific DNA-cytosine methylase